MNRSTTTLLLASFACLAMLAGPASQAHAQLPAVGSATVTSHYDANAQSFSDGAAVSTWTATTGPDATAESAGVTPTFQTGWSPSGLPGVVFDGVDDRMLIGTDPSGVNAEAMFAVLKMNGTGSPEQQQIFGQSAAKVLGVRNGVLFVLDEPAGTGFSDTTSLHVISWVSGTHLRIDGVDQTSDTVRTVNFTDIRLIGDERETPPDNPGPDMTFGELITYSGAMTLSDRQDVESFLTNKWIVPEPTSLVLLGLGGLLLLLRGRNR